MPNATPIQQELSDELDMALLAAVKLQKTADEPNAAILNAATARLRALGITHMVTADSAAAQLAEACGLSDPNVLAFPSIEDLPEAANGGI